VFGWALHRGQFDDLEREGERILQADSVRLDNGQGQQQPPPEESPEQVNVRD